MAYEWAVPGAKVVCVDGAEHPEWMNGHFSLEEVRDYIAGGTIYTVRLAGIDPIWDMLALWLKEVDRTFWRGMEPGFDIRRFRPLVSPRTQQQDLAVFILLLTPDPIIQADLLERDMSDAEARLNHAWGKR